MTNSNDHFDIDIDVLTKNSLARPKKIQKLLDGKGWEIWKEYGGGKATGNSWQKSKNDQTKQGEKRAVAVNERLVFGHNNHVGVLLDGQAHSLLAGHNEHVDILLKGEAHDLLEVVLIMHEVIRQGLCQGFITL